MRRYTRTLIFILILVAAAGAILGIQNIQIGDFERGGDNVLGLSLGLDLQGGSHLVYRAALTDPETGEIVEVTEDQMEALRRTIERRINSSGLGEPILQLLGNNRLLVQLPGISEPARAKSIIGETARLEFKHRSTDVPRELDEITSADVVSVTAELLPEELLPEPESLGLEPEATSTEGEVKRPPVVIVEFTEQGAQKFADVVNRLVQSFTESLIAAQTQSGGFRPPSSLEVSVEGDQALRLDLFGTSIQRIGTTTRFALALPQTAEGVQRTGLETVRASIGDSPQISFTEIQGVVDEDIGLTGDDLDNAYASQHAQSGQPIVNLEFNDDGTRIFGELTEAIVAKENRTGQRDQIAIFLDGQELISPTVQTVITAGTAFIQGADFTLERVRDLALLLESGKLPIPIELIQERDVDAILGADSLSKSVVAGLVGLALVLVFMTLYYRLPGFVASLALLIYAALVLAIFKILPVTLTLSGIGAVILSIGMAVDANILIFERMKEELRSGRTLLSAINIGFNRAWPAIRDGNISTLITCCILFWFADQLGATIVQGFAVTLAIGVLVSMFSAITVSRTFLRVLSATAAARRLGLFIPSGGRDLPQQQGPSHAVQRS